MCMKGCPFQFFWFVYSSNWAVLAGARKFEDKCLQKE